MKIGELVTGTKALIMSMYLDETDTRPWCVAFSGGKDSTALMGLVVSVIEALPPDKRKREIYGVMSDTIVENPLVQIHMEQQAKLINAYCGEKRLPVSVTKVSRKTKESYFVKIMGLGYFLPMNNGKGRWCTSRLKIRPQNEFMKEKDPSYILTGVRHAESTNRSKSIDKWHISEFIGNHVDLKALTFNPLVNWTVQDVWKFLEMEGLSWGSTLSVRTIYKDATGECGFTNPEGTEKKGVEVCGARHGCWLCPVILKDKSTEKMSEKHDWLEPLTEWRQLQLRVYGNFRLKADMEKQVSIRLATKSGTKRDGRPLKPGQGTLTVHARKYLLEKLLETEALVNRIRKLDKLEPIKLISQEEINLIYELMEDDMRNKPYLTGELLSKPIIDMIEGE